MTDRGTPTVKDDFAGDDEVSFVLGVQTRLLGVGIGLSGSRAADWFSHAVARKPSDLRRHVQRIVHLCELRAPEAANALADLFLVLGTNGYPLRERMFRRVAPLLSAACRDWFRERLADGRAAHVGLPEGCIPLLGNGATGTTILVERVDDQATVTDIAPDLLESINEHILQSQFDAACDLLVDGIRAEPDNLALQSKLAKILAHRNDPEARQAYVARLRALDIEPITELRS